MNGLSFDQLKYSDDRWTQSLFYSTKNCKAVEEEQEPAQQPVAIPNDNVPKDKEDHGFLVPVPVVHSTMTRVKLLEESKEYIGRHTVAAENLKKSEEPAKQNKCFTKNEPDFNAAVETFKASTLRCSLLVETITKADRNANFSKQEFKALQGQAVSLIVELSTLDAEVAEIAKKIKPPKQSWIPNDKKKWENLHESVERLHILITNVSKGCLTGIGKKFADAEMQEE